MIVRQSAKMILVGYVLFGVVELAILAVWLGTDHHPNIPFWVPMLLPEILLVFLAIRHVGRLSTKLSITGDRLHYEQGLFGKTTRTIELSKVQDVRIDQSLGQRILKVGNLSVETAGGSSRIEIPSIDNPHEAASHILDLAKAQRTH
jgi:uncharacterized membrane protein YdbT with pleckstrin-like domain